MKAVILAAGYGRRMQPLTYHTHKTLLRVGRETILERIIKGLEENGINEVVLATGYQDKELRQYLQQNFKNTFFSYVYSKDYAQTNNIYSLALVFEQIKINNDILLIESDLVYEKSVIKKIINTKHDNVALVDKYKTGMDGTVVALSKNNKIVEIIPPHLQGRNFNFSNKYKTLNIYKFSKLFCQTKFKKLLSFYAKTVGSNYYYELMLGILIYLQHENIYAEIIEGEKWAEVDDPNDLQIAEFVFSPNKKLDILNESFGGYWNYNITDFCFIRNMYFPNSAMLAELRNNLAKLLHNYGSKQNILNQKLAYFLKCSTERVQLLNGASQVYPLLRHFLKDKSVLIPEPSFGEYSRMFDTANSYKAIDKIDLEEVSEAAKKCKVVMFVNPNNPTGCCIDTKKLYQYAKSNPDKLVLIDESFIAFTDYSPMVELLEANPLENVIVLVSMSKQLGVPGIRLGYVYSHNKEFMRFLQHNTPIWNINSVAENFLEIILKHRTSLEESYKKTKTDREEFIKLLEDQPLVEKVYPSGGNFIMVKLASKFSKQKPGENYLENILIKKYNIYIKNIKDKVMSEEDYYRFAVRLPKENRQLISILRSITKI